MNEAAFCNLVQLGMQPSEIRELTWPQYLTLIIGSIEDEDDNSTNSDSTPVDGRGALERIMRARDSVTSVSR
jgi:hypothetical protein